VFLLQLYLTAILIQQVTTLAVQQIAQRVDVVLTCLIQKVHTNTTIYSLAASPFTLKLYLYSRRVVVEKQHFV
jgi:hypothetical protein